MSEGSVETMTVLARRPITRRLRQVAGAERARVTDGSAAHRQEELIWHRATRIKAHSECVWKPGRVSRDQKRDGQEWREAEAEIKTKQPNKASKHMIMG